MIPPCRETGWPRPARPGLRARANAGRPEEVRVRWPAPRGRRGPVREGLLRDNCQALLTICRERTQSREAPFGPGESRDQRLASEIDSVRALMHKFSSVPMSVADACMVRMTELDARCAILTLDANFGAYRRHRRHVVPTIVPARRLTPASPSPPLRVPPAVA